MENKHEKSKFWTSGIVIFMIASICCFLWGGAYPAIKIGYNEFEIAQSDIQGKLIFAGVRFAVAGIIVIIFKFITDRRSVLLSKRDLKRAFTLGVIQTGLQYTFFYIGMAYVSGIRGSILNGTGTFFCIILAHIVYKNDKLNLHKILGCIIGFIGVIIVNLNGGAVFDGTFSLKGDGFIILAALMFSIASIYSKKVMDGISPIVLAGYQLFFGGTLLIICGYMLGGRINELSLNSIFILCILIFISAVAFALWNILLKYNKVSRVSIFNFLIPIFGSLLSAIFLGEDIFDVKILISLLFVSFGIFIVYKD